MYAGRYGTGRSRGWRRPVGIALKPRLVVLVRAVVALGPTRRTARTHPLEEPADGVIADLRRHA
jgi:hypothetical protein